MTTTYTFILHAAATTLCAAAASVVEDDAGPPGDDGGGTLLPPPPMMMWDPFVLHLFVDEAGFSSMDGLHFVQSAPTKTNEMVVLPDKPWDGGGPKRGQIEGYGSLVQVSASELRLYYMSMGAFGVGGALTEYLCVAVSGDSGLTWEKPELGLVEFDGSVANNIIMRAGGASVFIDDNPDVLPGERFKLINDYWDPGLAQAGATMFASADGFNFTRMSETSSAAIFGSDTQNIVLWDPRAAPNGSYTFYGRSHIKGAQNATCLSTKRPGRQVYEPQRSILHFEIGDRESLVKGPWPVRDADANATKFTILNADKFDPMCVDLYTSVATILGDAYLFFPQADFHLDTHESQGRPNDGILEARMAVSRNSGDTPHYITRSAWLPRGAGQLRQGSTGVYEGSFDAGSTAVARGLVHVGDETWLMGYGNQLTHSGYLDVTAPPLKPLPPCRGSTGECLVQSGFQKLVLRKNGFVALAADNDGGQLTTHPFTLPQCAGANSSLTLQLNIQASIGLGALVELYSEIDGRLLGQSDTIMGGGVEFDIQWTKPPRNATPSKQWVNTGCAYEAHLRNASLPQGQCDHGDYWHPCKTESDCVCWSLGSASAYHCGNCKPWKGKPNGVPAECVSGICQTPPNITNMTGGEFCGHWEQVMQPSTRIGTDVRQLIEHNEAQVVMKIKMWNTKLYSSQFLCSTEKNLPLKTTDSDADVMFWFYLEHGQDAWNYTAAASQNVTLSKFGKPPTSTSEPTASFSPFQIAYVVDTDVDASPLVRLITPPPWASQNETQSSESLLPLQKLGFPLIVPITVAGRTANYKSCDPNTNTSCLADLAGFLQSKSRRAASIVELVSIAKRMNFSGWNFDQENMMPSATVHTSQALTVSWRSFLQELASAMTAANRGWTVSVDICGCGGPIPLQRVSTFPDYMGMVPADWRGVGVEIVSMCTYSNDSAKEYLDKYDVFDERLTCLHDSYGNNVARVGLFQGMGGAWNPDLNELKRQLSRIAAANLTKLAIFNTPSLYSSVAWLDTIYDWIAMRKVATRLKADDENEESLKCWVEPASFKVPFVGNIAGGVAQPSKWASTIIDIAAQKGEYERKQVLVRHCTTGPCKTVLHNVSLTVNSSTAGLTFYSLQQGYVWLTRNFTAISTVRPNISLGADWYADPLLSIPTEGLTIPAGWSQPLMLIVNVSRAAMPGVYSGFVTVTATSLAPNGSFVPIQPCVIPFSVEVWNISLPPVGAPGSLGTQFNLEMQGAFGNLTVQRKWFDFLQQHRLPATYFPTSYAPVIQTIQAMVDAGSPQIVIYDVSKIVPLPKGSPSGLPKSGNYTDAEIQAALATIEPVYANLSDRGLFSTGTKFVVYGFDEKMTWAPQYPDISIGMRQLFAAVKKRFPMLQTMTAGFGWRSPGHFPPLDMPIDIYVQLYTDSAFSAHDLSCWPGSLPPQPPNACSMPKGTTPKDMIRVFNEAQRDWSRNHSYWWYFSIDPGGPGLNVYVQMEAIRPRLLFWLGAAHDVAGWLYWCDDCWEPNVQTVNRINGTMLTNIGTDVAEYGDGSLMYPGVDGVLGPTSSIRLENLADGVEDRELLHMLPLSVRTKLIARIFAGGAPITPAFWQNDPALLEQLRREAAHCVMKGDCSRRAGNESVQMWTTRATERVGLDTMMPTPQQSSLFIDFAAQRGERERAVLALRCSSEMTDITVTFSELRAEGQHEMRLPTSAQAPSKMTLEAFRQGFVFVNHTGMLGQTNTTPSWQPDPLLPLSHGAVMGTIPANMTQPVLVLLTVPPEQTPGNYTATATVQGQLNEGEDSFKFTTVVHVEVWPIDLLPVSDPSTMSTVFNFIDNVCAPYGPEGKSCSIKGANSSIHQAYLHLLATRRIPPTDFPNGAVKDPQDIAQYIRSGSRYIVLQDVSKGYWNNSAAQAECGNSGKFQKDWFCYSNQYISEMVESLRWQLDNLTAIGFGPAQHPHVHFVAYGFDERMTAAPGEADPTFAVRQLFGAVKEHFGEELTTMTTGFGWRETGKFPPLDLPLDVMVELYYDWCWDDVSTIAWPPAIEANNSQKVRCQLWREARAEWETNHTFWLYNACAPGSCGATARSQPLNNPLSQNEWLNFAYIFWKPINGRLLFWLPAKLNVTGWLYWADNVWQQPTQKVLFYPGPDGPLSSIRLENIGDGLEDYELFRRLKNTTRRDELITQLVQSGDLWTDSPALLEHVRRQAADSVIGEGSGHGPYILSQ